MVKNTHTIFGINGSFAVLSTRKYKISDIIAMFYTNHEITIGIKHIAVAIINAVQDESLS